MNLGSHWINIPLDPARCNQPAVSCPAFQPQNAQSRKTLTKIIGEGFGEKMKCQR